MKRMALVSLQVQSAINSTTIHLTHDASLYNGHTLSLSTSSHETHILKEQAKEKLTSNMS